MVSVTCLSLFYSAMCLRLIISQGRVELHDMKSDLLTVGSNFVYLGRVNIVHTRTTLACIIMLSDPDWPNDK